MKGCELCPGTARMYCESDQASLCFDCDAKVHGANFLVARHSRSLLCRSCQAPTPWKAAGPRLGPAFSVCDHCVAGRSTAEGTSKRTPGSDDDEGKSGVRDRLEEDDDGDDDRDIDEDDDDDDDEIVEDEDSEDEEDDDDEEGEEQVVPWTAEPPPLASSSSSEEESMERIGNGLSLKRMRGDINVDLPSSTCFQEQLPSSSNPRPSYFPTPAAHPDPARTMEDDEANSNPFRPLKDRRKANPIRSGSHQPSLNVVSFGSGRPPI